MRIALVPALAALALAVAGASSAATAPKTTKEAKYIDAQDGFSIILPPDWYAVPRSVTLIQATIKEAKKEKLKGIPTAYSFYLTAAGKQQLKAYAFQAFVNVYPSTIPIIPQVAIQISAPKKPYKASQLKGAGFTFASVLAQNKGSKVAEPVATKLPEGAAEFFTASIPVGQGLDDDASLYLLIHGGKLYVLKFDIASADLTASATKAFRSIAENFRFV